MEAKHTPGPWDYSVGYDPHNQGQVFDASGRTVAISYSDNGGVNARLIAAAPDMLTACQKAIDTILWALEQKKPKPGTTDPCAMACQDLRSVLMPAIEKATA